VLERSHPLDGLRMEQREKVRDLGCLISGFSIASGPAESWVGEGETSIPKGGSKGRQDEGITG